MVKHIKLAVFSAKSYDKTYLAQTQARRAAADASTTIELIFHEFSLSMETVELARGATAVCVFVNDAVGADVLEELREAGVVAVLLRCAGHNNVDLEAASRLGLAVASVPSYAPQAVAEFSVALMQTLNRQTHRAFNRVREGNFSLDGLLLGRTLHGKTVGIVGTGRIGVAAAQIFAGGYGCRVLAYDPHAQAPDFPGRYVDSLAELLPQCDFVSLHCPLTPKTRHLINAGTLALLKPEALLVNTSRGALIDTSAVIAALKARRLGGLALDVYESEGLLFYNDHSGDIIDDDELMRLMTFPNVIVCGHQAFFTEEALTEIAAATLQNLADLIDGKTCPNALVQQESVDSERPQGHVLARRDSLPVRI